MQLTVYNGSPRGMGSNTGILLDHFLDGFMSTPCNTYDLAYLFHQKNRSHFVDLFLEAENILIAFPLYFDAMPSIVKMFIESLEPHRCKERNTSMGFIVQSGFPEAIHAQSLEKYLEKLAGRLGCSYNGTIIKGGVESFRMIPLLKNPLYKLIYAVGKATNIGGVGHLFNRDKLCNSFYQLGRIFGKGGVFDLEIVRDLSKPEKLSLFGFYNYALVAEKMYWDQLLKRNGVFNQRDNRPYVTGKSQCEDICSRNGNNLGS